MTTYKDALTSAMTKLGEKPDTVFIGYNVCKAGGSGGGTFAGIPEAKRQEMPLAENLMMGAAIGLSLQGYVPLVWIERSDFLTCCMDAIVNHLDKLRELSDGTHQPACIIRAVVGNKQSPLFTGATHTQNFVKAMRELVKFPVKEILYKSLIESDYEFAYRLAKAGTSSLLIEHKDGYSL